MSKTPFCSRVIMYPYTQINHFVNRDYCHSHHLLYVRYLWKGTPSLIYMLYALRFTPLRLQEVIQDTIKEPRAIWYQQVGGQ